MVRAAMATRNPLRFSRLLVPSLFVAPLAIVVACSADGGSDVVVDPTPVDPAPTAVLPAPNADSGDNTVDSGSKDASKDAKTDAKTDSGVDAGKPAPNPGDPCPKNDEVITRSCGACGKQQALCLSLQVSEYGPCEGEIAGGCIPGSVVDEACGNCGTRKKSCNAFCAFTTSACTGEPPSSCTPTANDYTTAGCPAAGVARTRTCSATCAWSSFSATCSPLDFQLTVSATAGEMVSGIYPLRAARADKRLTGTCPTGTLSTTTTHPYAYVELINPSAQTLTLSAWNTIASTTSPIIDTVMTWYATGDVSALPGDDAARKLCAKAVVDACPSGLPCGDTKWAGVTGTNAITIPGASSVTVFFGSYYAAGSSSATEGDVKLVVRTDTAL